ncbi:hypothetical protein BC834DRAFT_843212 [Gloeopeniophorella convolvens]|nr:hypothetical protein BC834DRAFT_843212 [Gloeopeniophorella convolvens]
MSMPDSGHVWLILHKSTSSSPGFYLDLEIDFVKTLCHKPIKYLKYLACCILGLRGEVFLNDSEQEVGGEEELCARSLYFFRPDANDSDALGPQAIGMDAIKEQSSVRGTPTSTQERFKEELLERDVCCIFTGARASGVEGAHIIPFIKQDEWIQMIIQSRTPDPLHPRDNVQDLTSINDVRNGISVNATIHKLLGIREYAVLATPNYYLETGDVPSNINTEPLHSEIAYPDGQRYTLQSLVPVDAFEHAGGAVPGADAAFRKRNTDNLPSKLLLAYVYGATAVVRWGHNWEEVLSGDARRPFRPPTPQVPAMDPNRTNAGGADALGDAGGGVTEERYDAMDLVAYFWYNTLAARERREQSERAFQEKIHTWLSEASV